MKKSILILAALSCAAMAQAAAIDLSSLVTASSTITYSADNDDIYPWSVTDGVLTGTHTDNKSTSWCTLTLSSPGDVALILNYDNNIDYSDYFYIEVDGRTFTYHNTSTTSAIGATYYIPLGTSKTVRFGYKPYYSSDRGYKVQITDIRLVDMDYAAINIDLSEAGTLGVEALATVNTLPDMRYLKLTGPMNSADWTTISNMTGMVYCDMSGVTVTDIPAYAFTKTALRFIKFPSALKTIGNYAFNERALAGPLTLPGTLESIGNRAFGYTNITSLIIPPSVVSVGTDAFLGSYFLTTVDFGGVMTTVPESCFQSCQRLTTVIGLDNVKTVDRYAFQSCQELQSLGSFQPVTIGTVAFTSCYKLQAIDLSMTTTIGQNSFENCDELTSIDLSSLTDLASQAFQYCDKIQRVKFNDKITTIPSSAFAACKSLEEVDLGASVRSIGGSAFNSSENKVVKVYVKAPTPPSISGTPFYSTSKPTLYVPEYAMVSYKLHDYWSKFTTVDVNPESPTEIRLYSDLQLTSNARIPDSPDVFMGWATSSGRGGSLIVNGDKPQAFGDFVQVVTNYKYGSNDPCTSTLISRCANMTSTGSTVRYYCDNYNTYWYYITMPYDVRRCDITTQNGADIAVRYYDGQARADYGGTTGSSWRDVPADATLLAGQGYIFCLSKADFINLPATDDTHNMLFASSAITTPLNEYASNTTADAGWNLVGNPYSAFFDIYQMDYTAPITIWDTSNKTFKAYSIADDDLALYPLQAFFVQRPTGVDAITFQPRGRQTTPTIERAASVRAKDLALVQRHIIDLVLSDGVTEDMTRVVVNADADDLFDAATDAAKMMSYDSTAQIYTCADGYYAINEGNHASNSVAIGVWFPEDGSYTIDLRRADLGVTLYDRGGQVSMPYTFTADAGADDARFHITLNAPSGITDIDADATTNTDIYDLQGRRVTSPDKGIYILNHKKVQF